MDTSVACAVRLRCGSGSVLSCAVVIVISSCVACVGTFDTLVLVAIRLATVGVLRCTNAAGSDVVIGTLHTSSVGTVVLLEDSLAVSRETILCTLNTEVTGVTERAVGVLTCTGVGLLVGFGTFHTLVLLTVGHSRILQRTVAIEDRCVTAVGTLHTHIVLTGQATTVRHIPWIPLGRTLTTLVIYTVFEVTVDVLAFVERREALIGTFCTVVVGTVWFGG